MRRALTVLVLAGALAALLVTASQAPRPVVRFELVLKPAPALCPIGRFSSQTLTFACPTHAAAERLRSKFGGTVHGRTVVIPINLPPATLP